MRLASYLLVLAVSMIALRAAPGIAAEPVTARELEELRASLCPTTTEPWRTIPWRISLLEGQRVAATEKKPIFIWAMDGHPLGCT